MPVRDGAPVGAPCWIELFTKDPDTTRAFYNELFGWTCEAPNPDFGGYFNFSKNGVRVAGGYQNDGSSGAPDAWSVYLATDDAQVTADRAAANGGTVVVPPLQVATLGTMEVFLDPGNASIGGWQSGEHRGFGLHQEPGTPSWFELHTRDYDKAVAFYKNVFAWDAHTAADAPEFRYTTYGDGDDALAGIMDSSQFMTAGEQAHWAIYFHSSDAEADVAKVEKLGGSVVMATHDTPYGRLAVVADPTGIQFRFRQPPTV
jgi:predicted enzyme related to lactoylglutathione lyase